MRRAWIAVVAVAVLATPAAGFAHGDDGSQSARKNASKVCKALRAQMGPELFRQTYGKNRNHRNAHGKCVSKHRHAVKGLIAQAVRECRAEQAALKRRHFKGDDDSRVDRPALRECVRQKLQQLLAERRAAFEAAAKSCDAERTADPVAFREKYGKGEEKRHAFFSCVVQTFRANKEAAAPPTS